MRDRPGTSVERIEQATQELAAGLGEAASAAAELNRAMDQISSGAEEAAGAAHESLQLIAALSANFRGAREQTETAGRQVEAVQGAFLDICAQIDGSVAAIELTAQRQLATVAVVRALEQTAGRVGEIGASVADISDQTSLLALNATIEAARAGDAGAGFAVVADAVRALAEASEASARDMQGLASGIGDEVDAIAENMRHSSELASSQALSGRGVIDALNAARDGLATLKAGARDILNSAAEAESAMREAERGAEQVASAAEEQSAAAAEVRQAIEQQSISLEQSQQTAEALADLVAALNRDGVSESAGEEIAAAAEELSATVQELSGTSAQILVALEQIEKGAQIQAAATLLAAAAMTQMETSATLAQARAAAAKDLIGKVAKSTSEGRLTILDLAGGIANSVAALGAVQDLLTALNATSRRIEKIADGLAMVSVQTNMLAVSGAVEATKAGASGRGFASVAGDIRKLSQEAAGNADGAKDTIQTLQDHTAAIRRDLDQIAGAAESEIARNRAVVDRFSLVVADLEAAEGANVALVDGTRDMLRSLSEIRGGTDQIAEAAKIASGSVLEAAVSARQQTMASDELAAAVEEIASIATTLVKQGV